MSMFEEISSFKANWIDVALIKIAVFAATLLVAKLWQPILSMEWYVYLLLWIIAAIKPVISIIRWMKSLNTELP